MKIRLSEFFKDHQKTANHYAESFLKKAFSEENVLQSARFYGCAETYRAYMNIFEKLVKEYEKTEATIEVDDDFFLTYDFID